MGTRMKALGLRNLMMLVNPFATKRYFLLHCQMHPKRKMFRLGCLSVHGIEERGARWNGERGKILQQPFVPWLAWSLCSERRPLPIREGTVRGSAWTPHSSVNYFCRYWWLIASTENSSLFPATMHHLFPWTSPTSLDPMETVISSFFNLCDADKIFTAFPLSNQQKQTRIEPK